jgi:PHP family Zn ribbon phosphoesterase
MSSLLGWICIGCSTQYKKRTEFTKCPEKCENCGENVMRGVYYQTEETMYSDRKDSDEDYPTSLYGH